MAKPLAVLRKTDTKPTDTENTTALLSEGHVRSCDLGTSTKDDGPHEQHESTNLHHSLCDDIILVNRALCQLLHLRHWLIVLVNSIRGEAKVQKAANQERRSEIVGLTPSSLQILDNG